MIRYLFEIEIGHSNVSGENGTQNGAVGGSNHVETSSGQVVAGAGVPAVAGPLADVQGEAAGVTVRGQVFCCSPRYTGLQYIGEGAYGMVV